MHFLHKTFPGTSDKISHCAKFHSSCCLISRLPKSDLYETTEDSPPLDIVLKEDERCIFSGKYVDSYRIQYCVGRAIIHIQTVSC